MKHSNIRLLDVEWAAEEAGCERYEEKAPRSGAEGGNSLAETVAHH